MTYHNYIFFAVDRKIKSIPQDTLNSYKAEFIKKITKRGKIVSYSYTILGLKANNVFALWLQADSLEEIQNFLNLLMHTKLGEYLVITQTLLGMTGRSKYSANSGISSDTLRKGGKYLVIYPFTKTKEWYMLTLEKRKELMKGHIAIGRKYPQITQLLLYSYGVDDQEFIVSYETDNLADFQKLVMELRTDKVRKYTLKDTPIFTCIYRTIGETLKFL